MATAASAATAALPNRPDLVAAARGWIVLRASSARASDPPKDGVAFVLDVRKLAVRRRELAQAPPPAPLRRARMDRLHSASGLGFEVD